MCCRHVHIGQITGMGPSGQGNRPVKEAQIHRVALDPKPHSVRQARRFAAECVAECAADERDDVVLLVSELVSNAVLHGGPHAPAAVVGLALEVRPDRVRVEVEDAGAGLPVVGDGATDRLGGRGLLLVATLASRWGSIPSDAGKTVWFEVATSSATGSKDGDGDE